MTQIFDIFLMPSGYYLIFGAKYALQAGSIEWMPALPLFDIGNNVSIPVDILGIYGNGLLPCLHSPEVRPSYMFRDWSEAYYGMVKAYQKWEGSFDLVKDFYYDSNKIEILFRDSSTYNASRALNILYNENGILQDYMDIYYDSNGNISSWERKVLINGPGS
ncbi:MAG: hypothetical protein K9W44_10715 [Candidatus Lokiarchaeota archaeon]|nr:hypothetical protein [Candidatus Harpocratesius repetitus]